MLNKIKKQTLFTAVIFTLSLLAFSCKSLPEQTEGYKISVPLSSDRLIPSDVHWEQVLPGIEKTDYIINEFNCSWTCVKIDLTNPKLSIVNFPEERKQVSQLFRVKTFSKKNKAVVAINTTPFDNTKAKTYNPIGIIINEGNLIYFPVIREDYAALAFFEAENGYIAKVVSPQKDLLISASPCIYAAGGFFPILKNGELISHLILRRSRTAAGISQDGKTLYLFAVSSILNPKDNKGLSYDECAIILQTLGCYDALNFDGGHSTALCINAIYEEKPCLQRKVPAALGFRISE